MKNISVFGAGVVAQTKADKLSLLDHKVMTGTKKVHDTLSSTTNDNFGWKEHVGDHHCPGYRNCFAAVGGALWETRPWSIQFPYCNVATFENVIVNRKPNAGTLKSPHMV